MHSQESNPYNVMGTRVMAISGTLLVLLLLSFTNLHQTHYFIYHILFGVFGPWIFGYVPGLVTVYRMLRDQSYKQTWSFRRGITWVIFISFFHELVDDFWDQGHTFLDVLGDSSLDILGILIAISLCLGIEKIQSLVNKLNYKM